MPEGLVVDSLDAYYGSAHVLVDISLDVAPGQTAVVLGRNGVGKSTLLKSIVGSPEIRRRGDIWWAGRDLSGFRPHEVARRGMILVPEDRRVLTSLSVRENVEMGTVSARRRRASWRFDELVTWFPKLGELADRKGNELSGGEQQLVAIVRALAGNPSFLLMDEPSAGLAPTVLREIVEVVQTLRAEFALSFLVTEQNAAFAAEIGDSVLVLESGKNVFTGTRDEFMEAGEIRERYLGQG